MEVTTSQRGEVVVAAAKGRVDSLSARDFEAALAAAVNKSGNYLILDCAELEYISSAGLRSLLLTIKKVNALGGEFFICRLAAPIREVLDVSGFVRFMKVCDRVEEAVASVTPSEAGK